MSTSPSKQLDTFPNPHPQRDYEIEFSCPEFTCVCPMTGQPDFADFTITYIPDATCVELKSLKLYLWTFRDEGHFHEDVTNIILNDLVAATRPRRMTVEGAFNVRGGIKTVVRATHIQPTGDQGASNKAAGDHAVTTNGKAADQARLPAHP